MSTLHPDLPLLRLAGRSVLPIVQGGMGVGVSAHRLAGAVASYNAVGTVSSVDLRRHHPDLMERHVGLRNAAAKDAINQANLEALDREVRAARELAGNRGVIAVNVMRAVSDYANLVRQSCVSGADAVVVGAGLPLDLPELAADFPNVALVPILSDARGIALILKKWERKGRLPDAIVIEHPRLAGGHLGAARIEDLNDPRFDFENVLPETLKLLRAMGAEGRIALVPAGGINSPQRVRQLFALGANAVQLGTPFVATEECDADPVFKKALAQAKPEDIVEFMSVAGLPARAVRTPWLDRYLSTVQRLQAKVAARAPQLPRCRGVFDCLTQCGLRDGIAKIGQFCIDHQLAASLKGDLMHGLFFRGKEALPFGDQIRTVRELLAHMLDKPIAEITALRDQVEAMFAPTTNDVA
jgi:nitronate monooxygenase